MCLFRCVLFSYPGAAMRFHAVFGFYMHSCPNALLPDTLQGLGEKGKPESDEGWEASEKTRPVGGPFKDYTNEGIDLADRMPCPGVWSSATVRSERRACSSVTQRTNSLPNMSQLSLTTMQSPLCKCRSPDPESGYVLLTSNPPSTGSAMNPTLWACSTRLDKKITTGCDLCPTRKPMFSSCASA